MLLYIAATSRVVSPAPSDGLLRPVHELWRLRRYCIHLLSLQLPAASIISHTGEHHIGSLLFRVFVLYCADWPDSRLLERRWRRLLSRQGRQEAVSLSNPGEPVALPDGVIRRLRAAMELARSIQGLLIGEGRQLVWLAAFLSLGRGQLI